MSVRASRRHSSTRRACAGQGGGGRTCMHAAAWPAAAGLPPATATRLRLRPSPHPSAHAHTRACGPWPPAAAPLLISCSYAAWPAMNAARAWTWRCGFLSGWLARAMALRGVWEAVVVVCVWGPRARCHCLNLQPVFQNAPWPLHHSARVPAVM